MRSLQNLASLLQLIKVSKVERIIIVIGEITKFWAEFLVLNFLTTMNCSPWVQREIWPKLKVAISPKPESSRPPKLVCMHLASSSTCINFLSRFYLIQFFHYHKIGVHALHIYLYLHEFFELILIDWNFWWPWTIYIVHSPKGNLAIFESSGISETRKVTPTKINVQTCYINA